ncbi:hydroxyacid dehydrogenase [Piscinibacter sakaiensis]|uniref:D-3-phosphoglycerate dehydrogenase n=1 Tax=Piscinibacter sakaiensis TaxID=1547922 RepID=A0A0K8P4A0_PISS1|nr:hydroxyacid dehydrogenase [Piscinibacter sakaiensis]GAP37472.1 D-3-phosphoglycerate dehydrogenase [Piscinibacter sakaiensis]
MKIVITEFMDAPAVAQLAARHEVVYDPTLVDDPARLHAQAALADALVVRNRTQVRGELLATLGRCRVVGRLGVGLDNIDVPGCEARGIAVIPATGANALSVAEYVVATAMLLLRGAYQASAQVAAGAWPRPALINGREAGGKTLGLVGFGAIGQLTARLAQGIGMRVIASDAALGAGHPVYRDTGVAPVGLDELVAQADVVSLHVPLVDSTRHLFDARRLAAMKPGAVLINTARGGIVDEPALAAALREGRLGGAAVDVFADEPLPGGGAFVDCPRLVLTPHIAGLSVEANERVSSMIAQRVLEALG